MQHVTFGMSIHCCLSSLLVRAELRTAFATLIQRFRNFRHAAEPDNAEWIIRSFARGTSRLVLDFDQA